MSKFPRFFLFFSLKFMFFLKKTPKQHTDRHADPSACSGRGPPEASPYRFSEMAKKLSRKKGMEGSVCLFVFLFCFVLLWFCLVGLFFFSLVGGLIFFWGVCVFFFLVGVILAFFIFFFGGGWILVDVCLVCLFLGDFCSFMISNFKFKTMSFFVGLEVHPV